jgi:hypothetical protein
VQHRVVHLLVRRARAPELAHDQVAESAGHDEQVAPRQPAAQHGEAHERRVEQAGPRAPEDEVGHQRAQQRSPRVARRAPAGKPALRERQRVDEEAGQQVAHGRARQLRVQRGEVRSVMQRQQHLVDGRDERGRERRGQRRLEHGGDGGEEPREGRGDSGGHGLLARDAWDVWIFFSHDRQPIPGLP